MDSKFESAILCSNKQYFVNRNKEMLQLLKRIRDDLRLRAELDGLTDFTGRPLVVDLSSSIWTELNNKIRELEKICD